MGNYSRSTAVYEPISLSDLLRVEEVKSQILDRGREDLIRVQDEMPDLSQLENSTDSKDRALYTRWKSVVDNVENIASNLSNRGIYNPNDLLRIRKDTADLKRKEEQLQMKNRVISEMDTKYNGPNFIYEEGKNPRDISVEDFNSSISAAPSYNTETIQKGVMEKATKFFIDNPNATSAEIDTFIEDLYKPIDGYTDSDNKAVAGYNISDGDKEFLKATISNAVEASRQAVNTSSYTEQMQKLNIENAKNGNKNSGDGGGTKTPKPQKITLPSTGEKVDVIIKQDKDGSCHYYDPNNGDEYANINDAGSINNSLTFSSELINKDIKIDNYDVRSATIDHTANSYITLNNIRELKRFKDRCPNYGTRVAKFLSGVANGKISGDLSGYENSTISENQPIFAKYEVLVFPYGNDGSGDVGIYIREKYRPANSTPQGQGGNPPQGQSGSQQRGSSGNSNTRESQTGSGVLPAGGGDYEKID